MLHVRRVDPSRKQRNSHVPREHCNSGGCRQAMLLLPWRSQTLTLGLKEVFQVFDTYSETIGSAHDFFPAIVLLHDETQTSSRRAQRVVVHHPVGAAHHRI